MPFVSESDFSRLSVSGSVEVVTLSVGIIHRRYSVVWKFRIRLVVRVR
jgi:hypothetical protein